MRLRIIKSGAIIAATSENLTFGPKSGGCSAAVVLQRIMGMLPLVSRHGDTDPVAGYQSGITQ